MADDRPCTAALQLLDLEGNAIADWAEVLKLAVLPSLRHLWLGSNRLQRIPGSAAQGILHCMQSQRADSDCYGPRGTSACPAT